MPRARNAEHVETRHTPATAADITGLREARGIRRTAACISLGHSPPGPNAGERLFNQRRITPDQHHGARAFRYRPRVLI